MQPFRGRPGGPGRRVGPARDRAIRQAHDILRASIRRGLLGPDKPLVEFRLTRSLGIGRNAVREALQALAEEGLVIRRPGVGTLVARPMLRVSADEILGFAEGTDEENRRRVTVRRLAAEPVQLGEVLTSTLGLPSTGVQVVELLVSVDDEPICLLASYLPREADVELMSLSYEHPSQSFERLLGVPLGRTTTMVEAINADPWAANALGVAPGTALILREQLLIDTSGTVAIFNFARYRADRVAFTASGDSTPGSPPDQPERP